MIKSIFLKKIVFVIAASTILLQIVFLLAAKNNSLAQVDETAPIAPSDLRVDGTPTSTFISLKWNDNSSNEDKFNVERKLTTATDWTGAWFTQIATANTITYTDTSVTAGVTYDYRVQACRSEYGCSDYTYLIGVIYGSGSDTISPSSPTTLVATKDDCNEVDLKWAASTDNVGVMGYEIWRSAAGLWSGIGQTSLLSYIDATVSPATPYYYKIIAYDAAGNKSSPSASLFLNTPAASGAPLPPSSVSASSTVGKIYVSWPASTSAVKYSIYRKVNGGSYQIWYTNITNLYYHDLSVAADSVYQYKVMGCDATTCSTAGTESNSVTYSGGEISCTRLNLTLNDGKTTYTVGDTVNYTWTCSPGGSASNVSVWLYKPDSTSTLYNSGSGSTQTMGFGTSNLMPGTHTLKACFDPDCKPETVYASKEFTIVSSTAIPTATPTAIALKAAVQDVSAASLTISGTKQLSVYSEPSGYLFTGVAGKIKKGTTIVLNIPMAQYTSTNDWKGTIDTTTLPNDIGYTFCASGYYDSVSYDNCSYSFNVNNAAASTATPTFTVTSEIGEASTGSTITGIKTAYANATPSISGYSLSDLKFKFKNTATGAYYSFLPSTSSANYWEASIDTSKLTNGNCDFFAEGSYAGTAYKSNAININVSNGSGTSLSISFVNVPARPFSGNVSLYAQTNQAAESVNFKVISTSGNHVSYSGTLSGANQYYFAWPTTNFSNGIYKIEVSAVKTEQATAYAYLENISIENVSATTSLDVSFINIPSMPLKEDNKIFIKTSSEPELVSFKVQRDLGSSAYLAATKIDATNFYFLWNTGQYYDGNYTVSATAKKGAYEKTSSINITVANYSAATAPPAATEPFILTFNEKLQPPLSGDRNIIISSNLKMDACKFNIEGPRYAEFAGTNNGLQCSFLLHTSNFLDGKYLVRAIATSGANTKEIAFDTTFLNQTSTAQPSTLPAQPVSPEYFIPQECKDKGYL
ncbi:MAG: hypothetical protein WA063_07520, partial [Minisyncoccia bacterium]